MTVEQVKILQRLAERCDTKERLARAIDAMGCPQLEPSRVGEWDLLRNALEAALALWTRLQDEALAMTVAADCGDAQHDIRWCPTCDARTNAIEEYRERVLKGASLPCENPT